ncbi:hypothetical protein [Geomobilimonas luticola]|uniref:Lipoprotein n=1 Tax=Geomobilimonas luticola TaxID=1114878 RepID=A0ABS5SDH3_9BACT|nr:hypothetical protein [Geomobilimonas luticola]MBT0653422.1 hypothetical protein [Geomobilimonas luticola]
MKRIFLAALMAVMTLPFVGCGGHDNPPPPPVVTQILSDPVYDGDIFKDNLIPPAYTVTQGMRLSPPVQSVFAGIDPTPVTGGEYRAFLDFFLGDPVGGVPLNVFIDSAILDMVVTSNIAGPIPLTIDLVSFQPPTMQTTDFDRSILRPWATTATTIFINQANVAQQVSIDVTPLMAEAQRQGFPDFQARILCGVGIIEIDDPTDPTVNRGQFAPLLQVGYFF